MNTGIQDAVNLSWKPALVSTGRARAGLLDSCQAERHPVSAAVIRQTNIMTKVMASSGAAAQLRNIGLFLLGHSTALGDAIMSNLAEVTNQLPDQSHRLRPRPSAVSLRSPWRPPCQR